MSRDNMEVEQLINQYRKVRNKNMVKGDELNESFLDLLEIIGINVSDATRMKGDDYFKDVLKSNIETMESGRDKCPILGVPVQVRAKLDTLKDRYNGRLHKVAENEWGTTYAVIHKGFEAEKDERLSAVDQAMVAGKVSYYRIKNKNNNDD